MRLWSIAAAVVVCSIVVADEKATTKEEKGAVLSGRVVDETGAPVTDAELTLSGPDYQKTQTDDQGVYSFAKIKTPGTYRVRIISTAWVSQADYSKLQQLSLTPKSRVTQDFTLRKAAQARIRTVDEDGHPVRGVRINIASIADERYRNTDDVSTDFDGYAVVGGVMPSEVKYILGFRHNHYAIEKLMLRLETTSEGELHTVTMRQGVTVTGTAVCSDGKPPAGWRVLAMPEWWHFGVSPVGNVITNEGVFELEHIVPGEYQVTISVPSGEGGSQPHTVLRADLAALTPPISVKMDYPSPASLVYISGTATLQGESDAYHGVWFQASSADRRYSSRFYLKKGSSEFKIGPIPQGDYTVSIDSPLLEWVDLDTVKAPTKGLTVPLVVRGKPMLNGIVTVPDGSELKNLKLSISKIRTLSGPNYSEDAGWRALDSQDGNFSIGVNSPGIYVVTAKADGFAPTDSEQINTTVSDRKPVNIELKRGLTLKGIVVDANGTSVAGARIQVRSLAGESSRGQAQDFLSDEGVVYSGDDGIFEIPHLPDGTETVKVSKEDYCFTKLNNVDVKAYTETPIRIRLTEGGEIRGLVFDGNGAPAAGVVLHFQDSFHGSDYERGRLVSTTTDQKGLYRVQHLPEQPVFITCGDEWNGSGVVRRAVIPQDGARLTVHFGGPATLTGSLRINGKPAAETRLTLSGQSAFSGIGKVLSSTNSSGQFTFHGAPPGSWTLYYGEGTRLTEWHPVRQIEVGASPTGDLGTIDLVEASVVVRPEFTDPADQDATRIELVRIHPLWHAGRSVGHQPRPRISTEEWTFHHVPAGEYEVICRRPSKPVVHHRVSVAAENPSQTVIVPDTIGTAGVSGSIDGDLLQNGFVDFCHDNGRWHVNTNIGADGQFEVANLMAGSWTIRAHGLRDGPTLLTIDLQDGQKKRIKLTKDNVETAPVPFGYATIEVRTIDGVLTPTKTVLLGPDGPIEPLNQYNAETGYFVPAGEYECVVTLPGFETHRETIRVVPYDPSDNESRARIVVILQEQ